jgi:hypothetical protein
VEGSEATADRLNRGKHVEHIEAREHVTETRLDSFGTLRRVNLSAEEPDALMRARPGLWEPWVGNCPGPLG